MAAPSALPPLPHPPLPLTLPRTLPLGTGELPHGPPTTSPPLGARDQILHLKENTPLTPTPCTLHTTLLTTVTHTVATQCTLLHMDCPPMDSHPLPPDPAMVAPTLREGARGDTLRGIGRGTTRGDTTFIRGTRTRNMSPKGSGRRTERGRKSSQKRKTGERGRPHRSRQKRVL